MKKTDIAVIKEYVSSLSSEELDKLSLAFLTGHQSDAADLLSANGSIEKILSDAPDADGFFKILEVISGTVRLEQGNRQ